MLFLSLTDSMPRYQNTAMSNPHQPPLHTDNPVYMTPPSPGKSTTLLAEEFVRQSMPRPELTRDILNNVNLLTRAIRYALIVNGYVKIPKGQS